MRGGIGSASSSPRADQYSKKDLRRLNFFDQVTLEVRGPFRKATICAGLILSSGTSPTFFENDRRLLAPVLKRRPWARRTSM